MRKKATYKPQMVEKGQMKTYKSPTIALRKKVGLKATQEQDWEGVGLPIIKKDRKRKRFNFVKGQDIKGGKGFKMKRKGIKSNIVKDVNVDMFKDRPYKKK